MAIRKRLGLSQTEFAKRLNVRQNMISQYECGRVRPSLKQIIKLLNLGQPRVYPAECLPLTMLLDEELGGAVNLKDLSFIDIDIANICAEEAKNQAELVVVQATLREIDALEEEQRQLNQKIAALHSRIEAATGWKQ